MENAIKKLDLIAEKIEKANIDIVLKDDILSDIEEVYTLLNDLNKDVEEIDEDKIKDWFNKYTYLCCKLGNETDDEKINELENEIKDLITNI